MTPCSEEEYYHKLDNLVVAASDQVRKIFRHRWSLETGENWVDDRDQVQKFLKGPGKKAFQKAEHFQRKALQSKCLSEWDIPLLFLILRNFGHKEKYKAENDAVYTIKTIRNNLAHHASRKVSRQEYDDNLAKLKGSLESLGMTPNVVEKLAEKMGVTSALRAASTVKKLHKQADELLKQGNFDKAINLYSEAIQVPSLLPADLGEAYEKRANCYLRSIKNVISDQEKYHLALHDAINAVQLNDDSWQAHYLTAKCYQGKNHLSKAKLHYQRALALSPVQTGVKRDYDACKNLASEQNKYDFPNCPVTPFDLSFLERLSHPELLKSEFERRSGRGTAQIKGQAEVNNGHKFLNGWGVPESHTKAAKCFGKAAALKKAEGMYNLGLCHQHGRGVKQDIPEALRLYQEVAALPGNTEGEVTPFQCNVGVAGAEYAIGAMYHQGIGVDLNFAKAGKWYHRAMEHGVGSAAHNLGHLHFHGQGMLQDDKMAEYCFKVALTLKDVHAPAALVGIYLVQFETDKALEMVRIGREMGNEDLLRLSFDEFFMLVTPPKLNVEQLMPSLLQFEQDEGITVKGLSIKERIDKVFHRVDPNTLKWLKQEYEVNRKKFKGDKSPWTREYRKEELLEIYDKAGSSRTARDILQTITYGWQLNTLLGKDAAPTKPEKYLILRILYEVACLNQLGFQVAPKLAPKLNSIVWELFHETCLETGEDDMTARFCRVYVLEQGSWNSEEMYTAELLKEGLRRYPDNLHYYFVLSFILSCKGLSTEARSVAEQGLAQFPDDPELLHLRVLNMEKGPEFPGKFEECFSGLDKFLEVAPPDHRHAPNAYYGMAFLYLKETLANYENDDDPTVVKNDPNFEKMEFFFKKGEKAEEAQLQVYLPYESFSAKTTVQQFLNKMKGYAMQGVGSGGAGESGVLERKKYLRNPLRKFYIREHRKNRRGKGKVAKGESWQVTPAKLRQPTPLKMSGVEPITLEEFNPMEDRIYENTVLDLTILEEPNPCGSYVQLIGEDDNGDVTRLFVCRGEISLENWEDLSPGCRIGVVNPIMRVDWEEGWNGIGIENGRCLVLLERVASMCRFCGEENAVHKCSKCKRPYCSRECQSLDWNMFQHRLICRL